MIKMRESFTLSFFFELDKTVATSNKNLFNSRLL